MITKELKLTNGVGMHARPASELANLIVGGKVNATIIYEGKSANVDNVLKVLALGIKSDKTFIVSVDGIDEKIVLDNISQFIEKLDY